MFELQKTYSNLMFRNQKRTTWFSGVNARLTSDLRSIPVTEKHYFRFYNNLLELLKDFEDVFFDDTPVINTQFTQMLINVDKGERGVKHQSIAKLQLSSAISADKISRTV